MKDTASQTAKTAPCSTPNTLCKATLRGGLVDWDMTLPGNASIATALVADVPGELSGSSFRGRWHGVQSIAEGGVVGALTGGSWMLEIAFVNDTNLSGLKAYDASGNDIAQIGRASCRERV